MAKDKKMVKISAILEGINRSYFTESDEEMSELITDLINRGYTMSHIKKRLNEIAENPPKSMKMFFDLTQRIEKAAETL